MKIQIPTGLLLLAVATVSPSTWAGCDSSTVDSSEFINSAYSLSGQGNFNCSSLGMSSVSSFNATIAGNAVTAWSANEQVDAVVVSPSKGKRCSVNYLQGVSSDSDVSLTTPDGSAPKNNGGVIGCTDGQDGTLPPPEPPPPLSTAQGQCAAVILVPADPQNPVDCTDPAQRSSCVEQDFIVATAYTQDGAAVCTGFDETQALFSQRQCINECIDQAPTGSCTPNSDGSLPISCSPCAPSDGTTLKYCHEWTDKFCRSIPGYENHGDCDDPVLARIPETFFPSTRKFSPAPDLDIHGGSTCYVQIVRLFGRVYAYTSCTGQIVDLGPDPGA